MEFHKNEHKNKQTNIMNKNLEETGNTIIFFGTIIIALGYPFFRTWAERRMDKRYAKQP